MLPGHGIQGGQNHSQVGVVSGSAHVQQVERPGSICDGSLAVLLPDPGVEAVGNDVDFLLQAFVGFC